jgi:serine/threonine-protein kinase
MSAPHPSSMAAPMRLGRYRLMQRIAYGGMAEIFRATTVDDKGRTRLVAIKRLLAHLSEDSQFLHMLIDEARIASRLVHPNICRMYELSRAGTSYFLALEYIDGKDLRSVMDRCRARGEPLDSELAAHVIAEVCEGLHAAHVQTDSLGQPMGIVHRDVSPSNVICAYAGDVKLCDFGIAKASLSSVKTQTGMIKGKAKYMSPEQAAGHKLDHRSDLFSLGSVLYELVTSAAPFQAANELDMILRVRAATYSPTHDVNPQVPVELSAIIGRALARSRDDRWQSAKAMGDALRAFLSRRPEGSVPYRTRLSRYLSATFAQEIARERRMFAELSAQDDGPAQELAHHADWAEEQQESLVGAPYGAVSIEAMETPAATPTNRTLHEQTTAILSRSLEARLGDPDTTPDLSPDPPPLPSRSPSPPGGRRRVEFVDAKTTHYDRASSRRRRP